MSRQCHISKPFFEVRNKNLDILLSNTRWLAINIMLNEIEQFGLNIRIASATLHTGKSIQETVGKIGKCMMPWYANGKNTTTLFTYMPKTFLAQRLLCQGGKGQWLFLKMGNDRSQKAHFPC